MRCFFVAQKGGEAMAMTLRASIALYDGMTSPLRHMTNAMNTLLSGFERMQDASKKTVDV